MTKRNSDDISILIRSNELLSEMLDEMLTESYIAPETLINYHENLMKCKRAVAAIKEKNYDSNLTQQEYRCFAEIL